jgi:adenylate kinase family enzyme
MSMLPATPGTTVEWHDDANGQIVTSDVLLWQEDEGNIFPVVLTSSGLCPLERSDAWQECELPRIIAIHQNNLRIAAINRVSPQYLESRRSDANMFGRRTVVSGFPGVGKSTARNRPGFVDLDSSSFSKNWKGEVPSNWPYNYMNAIQCHVDDEIVFVSSHEVVREALEKDGLPYVLVYPEKDCLDEYMDRYRNRGSSEQFIDLIRSNWDAWLDKLADDGNATMHIKLKKGQYASDIDWDEVKKEMLRRQR